MANYQEKNRVEYLIDGIDVFKRTSQLLNTVANQPPTPNAFFYMRMWLCDPETVLEEGPPRVTFRQRVRAVATANHKVRILLWLPSGTAARAPDVQAVKRTNERCKLVLEGDSPNTKVQLFERSDPPFNLASYHEKTMIFKTDAVVTIIGGLNVADAYRDELPHDTRAHWHDAAVEIVGPATDKILDDFEADWNASPSPVPALDPRVVGQPAGDQEVFVASTTLDSSSIFEELKTRIDAATKYIYMENFSIHEKDIIKHIADRISATRLTNPIDVILLVPELDPIYGWLHFVTYVQLSFARCTAFQYQDPSGAMVTVNRTARWSFERNGAWYEDSTVSWGQGSITNNTNIKNIQAFRGGVPLYKAYYASPASPTGFSPINVHSKVCIFDDRWAGVGSANFNPRSMYKDGELTTFIHDAKDDDTTNQVVMFRKKLWGHWFASRDTATGPLAGGATHPNPPSKSTDWSIAVGQNSALASQNRLIPGGLYVFPVDIKEYPRQRPDFVSKTIQAAIAAKGPRGSMLGKITDAIADFLADNIDKAEIW